MPSPRFLSFHSFSLSLLFDAAQYFSLLFFISHYHFLMPLFIDITIDWWWYFFRRFFIFIFIFAFALSFFIIFWLLLRHYVIIISPIIISSPLIRCHIDCHYFAIFFHYYWYIFFLLLSLLILLLSFIFSHMLFTADIDITFFADEINIIIIFITFFLSY